MFKLTFHPAVSEEIKESYNWYQEMAEGLGENFHYIRKFPFIKFFLRFHENPCNPCHPHSINRTAANGSYNDH